MNREFEFLDKELAEMYPEPENISETRFVDKLMKVFLADGREEWLPVHVEVQGGTRQRTGLDLLSGCWNILQEFISSTANL